MSITKYNCKICNYSTNRYIDLARHNQSKKHINNIEQFDHVIDQKLATNEQKLANQFNGQKQNEKQILKCLYCEITFQHKSSLSKHQNYRCKMKDDILKENEILKMKIEQLSLDNQKLIDTNLNNSEVTKKSMNIMTYALKHFDDAPPISLLQDDKFDEMTKCLVYDDDGNKKTNKSVEEIIIFHFKKDTLVKVLSELITNEYKKDDPTKQSIWSSDISRLTFIVKDIIGKTKKSKWVTDKKGLHITQTIINPMMEIIKDKLIKYVNMSGKLVNKSIKNGKNTENILARMHDANLVLVAIKLGKIHSEILRHIAPYLNLNIDICNEV